MKNFYRLLCISICCFLCTIGQNVFAQPPNDECSGAIDISNAFMGTCGEFTFNGPFDLTGSTPGVDDPPEPGEMGVCDGEEDGNLFGDGSETWENSVWYTWTVPDLNGDGSDVAYSIWTSDGSYNDDCGLNPNNILAGDADTQVAIYKGADCPNSGTGECDHFAANEDLFTVPPWISGWLTLNFTPGETYYMGVDGWDGVQGEFCLTVVICGVECGDNNCAPVETYCDCEDCREECPFADFAGIDHREDGNFRSPDYEGNIFVCPESVVGYDNGNVYLGIIAAETETCDEEAISLPLELSVGSLLGSDEDGMDTLSQGFFSYVELTPEDIATGSITITSGTPDGLGNNCSSSVTLNFADYPQATEPYCNLVCFAGGIDTDILDSGVTVCENTSFTLSSDGLEDLTINCASDNGSPFQFAWRVYADLYGTGDFGAVTSWQPLGPNPTINPADFFIDEFGYLGPYYTPGYPILPNTVPLQIRGAALCINEDGTIEEGCLANNAGYNNSYIAVTFLPEGSEDCGPVGPIMGCTDMDACNFNSSASEDDGSCTYPEENFDCDGNCLIDVDCAGECGGSATLDCNEECGGSAISGAACTDADGNEGTYDDNCGCVIAISGCTDVNACNYDETAEVDDNSCTYPASDNVDCDGNCLVEVDCAGECGGTATVDCENTCDGNANAGAACTDVNGAAGTYDGECNCIADPIPGCTDAGACNYDAAATEDDGSCTYPASDNVDCDGNCLVEVDCAGECGGTATVDCENTCGGDANAGAACTDANGAAGTYDGDCNCVVDAVLGCTDADACNYNAAATEDDNSCTYPASDNVDCDGNCLAEVDCAGECGGSATPGTPCTDANGDMSTYANDCSCPDGAPGAPGTAGTLAISSGGDYGSMNYVNDGATITVAASDFTLVPGQDVHYVFHEDGEVTSGTPLNRVLQLGSSFTNNGLGKKEIYVTAYGATAADTGGPNFDDPNITFSNTLPVTLLRAITIVIDEACDQLSSQFTFTVNITGGLPECVSTTLFSVSGDYFTGTLAHGESQSVGPIEDAENYVVSVSDDNGGANSISKAVNCSKLPIELISFKGEALEEGNILKWLTATEINNEFFTIESSVNGIDFKQLSTLKGQGNTSSASSYIYLDRTADKGLTYYRLSQTDFDGTTVKVGVISIVRGETPFNITDVYPIPTSDIINMDFMAPEQSVVDIEIYDLVGNTIEVHTVASLGNNLLKLNVADYPSGVYFISIVSDENKAIQKFVVE